LRSKLYARELFERLVKQKELDLLEVVWNPELTVDEQIKLLLQKG